MLVKHVTRSCSFASARRSLPSRPQAAPPSLAGQARVNPTPPHRTAPHWHATIDGCMHACSQRARSWCRPCCVSWTVRVRPAVWSAASGRCTCMRLLIYRQTHSALRTRFAAAPCIYIVRCRLPGCCTGRPGQREITELELQVHLALLHQHHRSWWRMAGSRQRLEHPA